MDHAHGAAANAEGADEHQQNAEPEAFEKYLSNHSCFSFCFDCCARGGLRCLPADEPRDAFEIAELYGIVQAAQPRAKRRHGLIRRREEFCRFIGMADEPVGPVVFSRNIKAAAEGSAGF